MSTSEKVLSKNKWYIAAFVLGIIAIIIGIIFLIVARNYSGIHQEYKVYGADFYTAAQTGIACAVNMLSYGYQFVAKAVASSFILIGGTQVCIFGNLIFNDDKRDKELLDNTQ